MFWRYEDQFMPKHGRMINTNLFSLLHYTMLAQRIMSCIWDMYDHNTKDFFHNRISINMLGHAQLEHLK